MFERSATTTDTSLSVLFAHVEHYAHCTGELGYAIEGCRDPTERQKASFQAPTAPARSMDGTATNNNEKPSPQLRGRSSACLGPAA